MKGLAFFDFDGTLVSGNVVDQYIWFARQAWQHWRLARLAWRGGDLKRTDARSREEFNHKFYREYAGFTRAWLEAESPRMYERYLKLKLFADAPSLVARNRGEGYLPVLVTGSLDFAMRPVVDALRFEHLLANQIEFGADGHATGRMLPPVLAGAEKVRAMHELASRYNVSLRDCRAYSDDTSDIPMLEAIGQPFATNPKPALRQEAARRNWPVLELGRPA